MVPLTVDITKQIPLVPLERPEGPVIVMTNVEYVGFQVTVILNCDHQWFAGIDLGHDPTKAELFSHWVDCDAARRFADHYRVVVPPDNFGRNFGTPMYSV